MKTIERKLYRIFLPRIASNICEYTIPRSGEAGRLVNCFSAQIDQNNAPHLLVTGISTSNIVCLQWDGDRYAIPAVMAIDELDSNQFVVTHYYGYAEINYRGILDLAIGLTFKWPYIKLRASSSINAADQYFFNKKKLLTKQRMDLLSFLLRKKLNGQEGYNLIHMLVDLYGEKWLWHPEKQSSKDRLRFYLESLVATGEVRKTDVLNYEATPLAIRTLEEYEEQERKHTENVKLQRRTFWLAVAVAALTVIQSGLVKLSPLIDLTKGHEETIDGAATLSSASNPQSSLNSGPPLGKTDATP